LSPTLRIEAEKKTIKLITQEYVFSFTSHIEEIILLVNDGSNRVNLVSGLMENRTDAEFAEDVSRVCCRQN
jgi:hypothetical protein